MRSVPHKAPHGVQRRLLFLLTSICFALSIACCFLLQSVLKPSFGEVEYITINGNAGVKPLPVLISSDESEMRVTIPVLIRTSFTSTTLHITPDDCLRKMWVNGTEIQEERFATCDYVSGKVVSFPELKKGANTLEIVIENKGGNIGISAAASPLDAAIIGMMLFELLIALWFLLQLYSFSKKPWAMGLGGAVGIALFSWLRVIYAFATPWEMRSYDAGGHVEYVEYLLAHVALPPRFGGWEFYHPPLYYVLNALTSKLTEIFVQVPLSTLMQIVSAVLTVATVPIIFWIVNKLPSKAPKWKHLVTYIALALPGIVFFSGRVNNDVLLFLLELCIVLLCLVFWEKKKAWLWYAAVFLCACALLTKTNAAVLFPFVAAALFLHPKMRLRQKLTRSVLAGIMFFGLTLWFFAPQLMETGLQKNSLVGNIGNLNGGLQLGHGLENYFMFSPIEVLRHPFNSPWLDSERRQYFMEYVFRSAFFGEFSFEKSALRLSVAMLASWLLLLPWCAFGLWEAVRKKTSIDMLMGVLFGSLVFGHFFFRFVSHYSSAQDFRFSPLIIISFIWLILRALDGVKGFWKSILLWLLGLTLFLELTFLIKVILS